MFERFTDRARRVFVLAQEEAKMLNHNYIGTEHILLGLIHEGEGVAFLALSSLKVSLDAAREEVVAFVGMGETTPTGHIPFTPRAKHVLEQALRQAILLGHNYIGTEHILLGLIAEGEKAQAPGVALQALGLLGVDPTVLRQQVLDLLKGKPIKPEVPRMTIKKAKNGFTISVNVGTIISTTLLIRDSQGVVHPRVKTRKAVGLVDRVKAGTVVGAVVIIRDSWGGIYTRVKEF